MSIKQIIENTRCPFASKAKLTDPILVKTIDIESEMKRLYPEIKYFFDNSKKLEIDALCIIFEDPEFGAKISNLSKNTKRFFLSLKTLFNDFNLPEKIIDYNQPVWPSINGERFFMVSFASCYSKSSPRYNHRDLCTYFFIQPVSSFERHAKDNNAITDSVRKKIREVFAKNGQEYDGDISDLKNEFVKLVSPLENGDKVVKWWE